MSQVATIRPVNSLIFISDLNGGESPEWIRDAMVWSTRSCVAVVCHPEQDGPTEVTLGEGRELDPGTQPLFDGYLEVPSGVLLISTVDQQSILQTRVRQPASRLRIWTNHPRWPDQVIVGVD